jgi:hypothetical protein
VPSGTTGPVITSTTAVTFSICDVHREGDMLNETSTIHSTVTKHFSKRGRVSFLSFLLSFFFLKHHIYFDFHISS